MSPTGVVAREALGVTRCESALESQVEGGRKRERRDQSRSEHHNGVKLSLHRFPVQVRQANLLVGAAAPSDGERAMGALGSSRHTQSCQALA
jgi:hypothetical protein